MATDFNTARKLLADAIAASVNKVVANQYAGQTLYAFAIVVNNDFHDAMFYASTRELLAERLADPDLICGKEMATWYFGNFDDEDVTPIEVGAAKEILEHPAGSENTHFQARYLWACANALRDAQRSGIFSSHPPHVTTFCTMIDDLNAIWIERETARFANPPAQYAVFESEQRAAVKEWFCKEDVEVNDLQKEFASLLSQDKLPEFTA